MKYIALAVLILVACDDPRPAQPPRQEVLLVVSQFGDTLVRLEGFNCVAGHYGGSIYQPGVGQREAYSDSRIAVTACVAKR